MKELLQGKLSEAGIEGFKIKETFEKRFGNLDLQKKEQFANIIIKILQETKNNNNPLGIDK